MSESLDRDQLIIDRMETLFESMQLLSQRLARAEEGLAAQYSRITQLACDKQDKSTKKPSRCIECNSIKDSEYYSPFIWGEK